MQCTVSLGSNIGDRMAHLAFALDALARLQPAGAPPLRCSAIYESAPVDCPPGSPAFLNMVAILESACDEPMLFLAELHAIERLRGRARPAPHHAPRTLDLDLLTFGDRVVDTPVLTLPHPRLEARAFVLLPLADIAPDMPIPPHGHSAASLLSRLSPAEVASLVKIADPPHITSSRY